jgi:NitT/TauT family transport system permease protein
VIGEGGKRAWTLRVVVPLVLLAGWQLLYTVVGEPALVSPLTTLRSLEANWVLWMPDFESTLVSLAAAYALAVAVGLGSGFLIGLSGARADLMVPLLVTASAVPKIVLYPIVLLIFGVTEEGRIFFAWLHGVLPIAIITAQATRTVPAIYLKLARSYRLSFWRRVRHVLIPAVMPHAMVALRMGFGLCFLGLVLAEMFAAYDGLGFRLVKYMGFNQTPKVLALALVISLLAFLGTAMLLAWEERREGRIGDVMVGLR